MSCLINRKKKTTKYSNVIIYTMISKENVIFLFSFIITGFNLVDRCICLSIYCTLSFIYFSICSLCIINTRN